MAEVVNLTAADQKNIIDNNAEPTLRLANEGTGPGLHAHGLAATSTASIDVGEIPIIQSGAAGDTILTLTRTTIGTASTPALDIPVASVASGPAIQLSGTAFVSVTTIKFTTGGAAGTGVIRVRLTDRDAYGWIPVLPDAAVTGATWE